MKTKKMSFNNIKDVLSRDEMKEIMAGSNVTLTQYCNTLCVIITGGCYSPACLSAWGSNCAPYGVSCH